MFYFQNPELYRSISQLSKCVCRNTNVIFDVVSCHRRWYKHVKKAKKTNTDNHCMQFKSRFFCCVLLVLKMFFRTWSCTYLEKKNMNMNLLRNSYSCIFTVKKGDKILIHSLPLDCWIFECIHVKRLNKFTMCLFIYL